MTRSVYFCVVFVLTSVAIHFIVVGAEIVVLRRLSHTECGTLAKEGRCENNGKRQAMKSPMDLASGSKMDELCGSDFCIEYQNMERNARLQKQLGRKVPEKVPLPSGMESPKTSFFELEARDIDGDLIQFDKFRGDVTVVVNVASFCGLTEAHYDGLVDLFDEFVDTERFAILAFPCNQFGEQEPESEPKIKAFTRRRGVAFTMMSKVDVNGGKAHTVFKFLKKQAGPKKIEWNFGTYYLIEPNGDVHSFSDVEPHDLRGAINQLLNEGKLDRDDEWEDDNYDDDAIERFEDYDGDEDDEDYYEDDEDNNADNYDEDE